MSSQGFQVNTLDTTSQELSDVIRYLGCFCRANLVRLSAGEPEEVWAISTIDGVVETVGCPMKEVADWLGLIALVINTESTQLIAGVEVTPIFLGEELSWVAIVERGAS